MWTARWLFSPTISGRAARMIGAEYIFGIVAGQVEPFLARRGFCDVHNGKIGDLRPVYFTGPNARRTIPTGLAIVTARLSPHEPVS